MAVPLSAADIVKDPGNLVGSTFKAKKLACIDDGPRFLCLAVVGKRIVAIDAAILGALTSAEVAERLAKECRGPSRLEAGACRFDVVISPTAIDKASVHLPGGMKEVVKLSTREIDLFPVAR